MNKQCKMKRKLALLIVMMLISGFIFQVPFSVNAASGIYLQMYNEDRNATVQTLKPSFNLVNGSSTGVNLSDVKIRYYYTKENCINQAFACDDSRIISGQNNTAVTGYTTGTFFNISGATGADCYLEVGFTSGAGTLPAGANLTIKTRIFEKNYAYSYTQTGDYSFNSTSTSYVDWAKSTVYLAGNLVYGTPPNTSGATSTTSPANTPTPQPSASAAATPCKAELFCEDFQSSEQDFSTASTGGWENTKCFIEYNDYATIPSGGSLVKFINAAGYSNITVEYRRNVFISQQAANKAFQCEWFDGTSWFILESVNKQNYWDSKTFVLPQSANGNANLKLRFYVTNFGTNESVSIDNIKVYGIDTNNLSKINVLEEKSALSCIITNKDNNYEVTGYGSSTNEYINQLFDSNNNPGVLFYEPNSVYVQTEFQNPRNIGRIRYYNKSGLSQRISISAANSLTEPLEPIVSVTTATGKWMDLRFTTPLAQKIFKITVTNATSSTKTVLNAIEFWNADIEKPSAVSGLNAKVLNARTVELNWSQSTDNTEVVGYKIYRMDATGETFVGRCSTNRYTDTLLTPDTSYTYKVCAYDPGDRDSDMSAPVTVKTSTIMSLKKDYKILLLVYDPVIKAGTYNYIKKGESKTYLVTSDQPYSSLFYGPYQTYDPAKKLDRIKALAENIRKASGGSVNFILDPKEINGYLPMNDPTDRDSINENNIVQYGWTGETVPGVSMGASSGPSYYKILKDNNAIPLIENGTYDAVWIAQSYGYGIFYETTMFGNNSFYINGEVGQINCSKKFFVFGYPHSYECFGHMMENIIQRAAAVGNWPKKWTYNTWTTYDIKDATRTTVPKSMNDFEKFFMTDIKNYPNQYLKPENFTSASGFGQVGSMHFPANGSYNYSFYNYTYRFNTESLYNVSTHGGSWAIENEELSVESNPGAKILAADGDSLSALFTDACFNAKVKVSNATTASDAGIIFRVTYINTANNNLNGYYAGIDALNDRVILGKTKDGIFTTLATAAMPINTDTFYNLKVDATGKNIKVYVDNMVTPKITLDDITYSNGAAGFMARNTHAHFDNLSFEPKSLSYAENWCNYPSIEDSGFTPKRLSVNEWNSDQDLCQIWMLEKFPKNPGVHTEADGRRFMNNWWAYLDFNRFDGSPINYGVDAVSFPVPPAHDFKAVSDYSGGSGTVSLSWTNPQNSGYTGFNIYRDGIKIKTITDGLVSSYIDSGLTANNYYTYLLEPFDMYNKNCTVPSSAKVFVFSTGSVFLNQLIWSGTPQNGMGSVRLNTSIAGSSLTINGTSYSYGLGTHATSRIKYDIDGKFTTFESYIGVDDAVDNTSASLEFQVYCDGVLKYTSGMMRSTDAAKRVLLDITGAKQLELVVTDGGDKTDYDYGDWAMAKLYK